MAATQSFGCFQPDVTAADDDAASGTLLIEEAAQFQGRGEIVAQSLAAENEAGMFVTVFAGVFDPDSGKLLCAAGGHDAPALIPGDGSAPRFVEIDGGPIIGLLPVAECPTNELTLAPDDAIVISTDGVFEARNIEDEFFSEERLLEVVAGKKGRPATEVTDEMLAAVKRFAGDAEQSDDITIMTLRYKG